MIQPNEYSCFIRALVRNTPTYFGIFDFGIFDFRKSYLKLLLKNLFFSQQIKIALLQNVELRYACTSTVIAVQLPLRKGKTILMILQLQVLTWIVCQQIVPKS